MTVTNPASWRGDVSVKNVVLLTSWEGGRQAAEEELRIAGVSAPFSDNGVMWRL
jgi:hypothetical protein